MSNFVVRDCRLCAGLPSQVSRLGFGCAGLSGVINAPLSHEAGCSIIEEAYNRGITLFDTADVYGKNHDNELMISKVQYFFIFQI